MQKMTGRQTSTNIRWRNAAIMFTPQKNCELLPAEYTLSWRRLSVQESAVVASLAGPLTVRLEAAYNGSFAGYQRFHSGILNAGVQTMKKAEVSAYKTLLLALRARLRGDVNQLADAALKKNRAEANGDLS